MNADTIIKQNLAKAIKILYNSDAQPELLQLQKTRKEFDGDVTVVTFPLLKTSKKSPEQTSNELGEWLVANVAEIESHNVIKGFLNLKLTASFWVIRLQAASNDENFGFKAPKTSGQKIMVEYSSPNTNKPLHLGHIRNNLLGWAVACILEANGHEVIKVNLVNDRGIHICKSMLAWQKFGNGETPESSNTKGDHLVGKYYVLFDKEYKAQQTKLVSEGISKEEAEKKASIILEAQEMLRKWEAKDPETIELWEIMNSWVYKGFDETYKKLGVSFDKIYYESDTYLLGKKLVNKGLEKGVFFRKDDNSVWVDLTNDGLDQKLLLRGDGTSVYMTQDLGTANQRYEEYKFDQHIYVVGNEQNYHFQVLKLILKKIDCLWANNIHHLSYGMVELPNGKMKSREGTVVDADELVDEMVSTARTMSEELGKLDNLPADEVNNVINMIGLGGLKYFMLKVDPRKTMLFDPQESIDFNGNTGSFIQYTHARIKSVLRKAAEQGIPITTNNIHNTSPNAKEIELIKLIEDFPEQINQAGQQQSPALVANFIYELVKEYNQFYHECPILKESDSNLREFRLLLSQQVASIIKKGMCLLGIEVPEKM